MHHSSFAWVAVAASVAACGGGQPTPDGAADSGPPVMSIVARHSSSIAVSPDGTTVFVVNPDADSVSVIDPVARTVVREIALGAHPPAVDSMTQRFDPLVGPRAIALAPHMNHVFVTGQWSSDLIDVDVAAGTVVRRVTVGSEPIGVVITPDERTAFVACAQDGIVVRVDVPTGQVTATATTPPKPWALGWSPDGTTLYTSHLLGPGVSLIDPQTMTVQTTATIPDMAYRGDRLRAYGQVRGIYDVVARPGSTEIWLPHLLLATQTAEVPPPALGLDFQSTVFPGVSILGLDGTSPTTLTVQSSLPGTDGQFADIVSGPHAIDFTPDGHFALVVDEDSEDVLAIDASPTRRVEATLLRPLPGHMPDGIVVAPDGMHAYLDERNTTDVVVIDISVVHDATLMRDRLALAVDGPPIVRIAHDPMPPTMRLGQHLFFSANSTEYPITQNRWVACASCHVETRSDAVVWRFLAGPRDTPSNAGGVLNTGFLLHTADRSSVRDYFETINFEQGGSFSLMDPTQSMLMDALTQFVNLAIQYPVAPRVDPVRATHGSEIFHRANVGCAGCHSGPYFTDSGSGNPTLDLAGTVLLHDVGTCDTGVFPDVAHMDAAGHARAACMFDTPTLRGIADSAPYFHDGSAATLHDVLENTRGRMGDISSLRSSDEDDLIEYLRSL